MSTDEVEAFRWWAQRYGWRQPQLAELADRSDAELQAAIDGAKTWIAGRRWSWTFVAANYLLDGRFHAGPGPMTLVDQCDADQYRLTSGWQEDVVIDGIETIGHSITMTFPGNTPLEKAKAKLRRICDEQKAQLEKARLGR